VPLSKPTAEGAELLNSTRIVSENFAADYLGISRDTLRRRRGTGDGPRRIQLSERRIGYRICDLDAWLEKRTVF
jgi:predicted DNA-binding transcriptional regulator AlpA